MLSEEQHTRCGCWFGGSGWLRCSIGFNKSHQSSDTVRAMTTPGAAVATIWCTVGGVVGLMGFTYLSYQNLCLNVSLKVCLYGSLLPLSVYNIIYIHSYVRLWKYVHLVDLYILSLSISFPVYFLSLLFFFISMSLTLIYISCNYLPSLWYFCFYPLASTCRVFRASSSLCVYAAWEYVLVCMCALGVCVCLFLHVWF